MTSPYKDVPKHRWGDKTDELIESYPLKMSELIDVVRKSWKDVFASKIGSKGFQIGKDIYPKPQIIAFFLHELIPLELAARYPGVWRREEAAADKDVVYVPDISFSMEIKTSSHPTQIFGNRSFAQQTTAAKKSKSGFYLAVNFEKSIKNSKAARLRRVRFGWLDHADWQGQAASTGQQARLSSDVERGKLKLLFEDC